MKFKQLSKELNEAEFTASNLTAKRQLGDDFKASLVNQIQQSDVDGKMKQELVTAIQSNQVEKALKLAINMVSASYGVKTSQVRSLKRKNFTPEEE